jgi:NAD(P)-dependent dehydrogenase (short-subunit alcohol dehydrogenase family)
MSDGRLAGKSAIVTGGARGLGGSIAKRFAEEGASVLIADILDPEGEQLAGTLTSRGLSAAYFHLDVTDEPAWDAVVNECETRFGPLDVLVNNAGILRTEAIADETLEGFRKVLDVNLVGVFLGTRAAVQALSGRGGSIINISSTWGLVGANGAAAYHASKGAVTILTKNAAIDHAQDGIRVNSIHPGPMQTYVADVVGAEGMAIVSSRTPMQRVASPDEVAPAAVYLASDESSFTTGSGLVVDGGFTAW